MRRFALALFLVLAAPAVARAGVTISEVLYDADGPDDGKTFVELFGPAGFSLSGWSLEGVNGAGGGTTHLVDLSSLTFPADGFLVVADTKSGSTAIAGADFLVPDFDLQNGPDSLVLWQGSLVADAVGYGAFGGSAYFAGEGAPAIDVTAGSSLARRYADLDTGDNASDFVVLANPTPGTGPVAGAVPTPEPGTLFLFGGGTVLLVLRRSRRRARHSRKQ